jgi:hypothetical protein
MPDSNSKPATVTVRASALHIGTHAPRYLAGLWCMDITEDGLRSMRLYAPSTVDASTIRRRAALLLPSSPRAGLQKQHVQHCRACSRAAAGAKLQQAQLMTLCMLVTHSLLCSNRPYFVCTGTQGKWQRLIQRCRQQPDASTWTGPPPTSLSSRCCQDTT